MSTLDIIKEDYKNKLSRVEYYIEMYEKRSNISSNIMQDVLTDLKGEGIMPSPNDISFLHKLSFRENYNTLNNIILNNLYMQKDKLQHSYNTTYILSYKINSYSQDGENGGTT